MDIPHPSKLVSNFIINCAFSQKSQILWKSDFFLLGGGDFKELHDSAVR